MKDYLINELIDAVEELEKQFSKVRNIKAALDEQEEFEQVDIIGAKEVAEMHGMSTKWAENLIRDIKKRCNVVGAGNKIPRALLLREIGHKERNKLWKIN